MCGIAGAFAYGPHAAPIDRGELLRVREHMTARGPDGAGIWLADDGRVGLAHRRLAIIELSDAGAQPMTDPETGNRIVFNGEIYNHDALRERLVSDGATVRTRSDTEVLLKLYAQHGAAMLGMLRGMFAFAVWDARERQLFIARDAFGVKPLYIADDGRCLRFASQVKALRVAAVDAAPDPAGHAGFLLWGSVPEPYTLHRGIRALPAGNWLMVRGGRVGAPQRFASPLLELRRARRAAAATLPGTSGARHHSSAAVARNADALEAVAAAVHDSVAAHMVADVPVGVFLSAGLDSAMIAACAAHLGELRTLTLGFDEYSSTPLDEAALAGETARALGAKHTVSRAAAAEFAADRERLIAAMDQPSIDGVNTWFVAKMAAQQGLKVALSGIGGDELFGSYPSFHQVPKLKRSVAGAARVPLLGRAVRRGLATVPNLLPSAKYAGIVEYGGTLGGAYLLRRALFMPWEIPALMDADMAAAGLAELDTLAHLAASIDGLACDRLAISALEMQWYMKNQLLRDADWAGMAHSLEIRVPFVDATLLGALVEQNALERAGEKRTIARAIAPELPAAVLERPKTGFAVPMHQWLDRDAPAGIHNHRGWARTLYSSFAAH